MCFDHKIPEWVYVYHNDVTPSTDSTEAGEHLKWRTFDSHSPAKRKENYYNNICEHSAHAKRKFEYYDVKLDHIDIYDKRRRCDDSGYLNDVVSFQSIYPDTCYNQRCHPFHCNENRYFHKEKQCRDHRYYNEPHFKQEKSRGNSVDRRMCQNSNLPMYRRHSSHISISTLPNNEFHYREMSNSWHSSSSYYCPGQVIRYGHRKKSSRSTHTYGSRKSDNKKIHPSGPLGGQEII